MPIYAHNSTSLHGGWFVTSDFSMSGGATRALTLTDRRTALALKLNGICQCKQLVNTTQEIGCLADATRLQGLESTDPSYPLSFQWGIHKAHDSILTGSSGPIIVQPSGCVSAPIFLFRQGVAKIPPDP